MLKLHSYLPFVKIFSQRSTVIENQVLFGLRDVKIHRIEVRFALVSVRLAAVDVRLS